MMIPYRKFHGLSGSAFGKSIATKRLLIYPQIEELREELDCLWEEGGVGVITGEMGMGKSSLARRLYDVYASERSVDICYIHTAAFRSAMDAARQISLALGLPAQRSFQRQMEALEDKMASTFSSNRNVIILLDDAQLMASEALEVIHRLYNFDYDAKVVQTLAFGQREMNSLFETNRPVNARVFVRLALPPLTLSSALQMVLFRLQVSGRHDPLIDDNAFELLYEKSQGVPREIIRFCALATDFLLQSDLNMINLEVAREVTKL